MFRRGLRLILVCSLSWAPARALAGEVRVELFTKVAQGQVPKLRIEAGDAARNVTVHLTRDDGKRLTFKLGNLGAGAFREVPLGAEVGAHHYQGKLTAEVDRAAQSTDLEFDSLVAPPLRIDVNKADVDLGGHKLALRLSRAASKVEIKVTGETGAVLADDSQSFAGKGAGEPLEVVWSPRTEEAVAKIELRAYDVNDFFAGLALFPWSVYIPHEEVGFRTDSAEIDASERPKLDASFEKVTSALAKYKEIGSVKLFIAGHTDTVGTASYNLALSQRRAQAIGTWFRKRGLRIAIAYEGFGESAPLVPTADNVDEPRNRRVDYILAMEEPQIQTVGGYRASWRKVP